MRGAWPSRAGGGAGAGFQEPYVVLCPSHKGEGVDSRVCTQVCSPAHNSCFLETPSVETEPWFLVSERDCLLGRF